MTVMTSNEIRSSFLRFFEGHHHRIVPSSSLVPAEDPTLLFTNAGMNQFKDVFTGRDARSYTRAATAQKCVRAGGKHNDLDNVGMTARHLTFFEMLGNFSFGDYFKEGAISFAWDLLTSVWKIDPARLAVTVFNGEKGIPWDEEAFDLWAKHGIPHERIVKLGYDYNFWTMGEVGPCGPCSEIHYHQSDDLPCAEAAAGRRCLGVACDCDRWIEVWNLVFMQFERPEPDAPLSLLPQPSIDTGMGLERVTAVMQGKVWTYDTDPFRPLFDAIGQFSGRRYGQSMNAEDVAMRVVADHVRSTTFLIADGVQPSNEGRGYVLRKIMRRAMRHGNRLGLTEPFLFRLVDVVVDHMGEAYPELRRGHEYIVKVVRSEEERFDAVLNAGLPRLEEVLDAQVAAGSSVVPGAEAFRLYDSFGLPEEFIRDTAEQRGLAVDSAGFEEAMKGQREKARAKSAFGGRKASDFAFATEQEARLKETGDQFEGYASTRVAGVPIVGMLNDQGQPASEIREGEAGFVALQKTPFYLESGGQVSDAGQIYTETGSGSADVEGLARVAAGWPRLHRVRVTSGALRERDIVTAEVDREARDATRRNHTATHLLHAALRKVLGTHVKQAGSLVAPDRLRFDFVHFSPLSHAEIVEIERLVSDQIVRNLPVQTDVRSTEEAIASGAMALFGEKYGDRVRVVTVPGFSVELCGGTHCGATGDIGSFIVTEEGGIAAGVRRIEAQTGTGAVQYGQARRQAMDAILAALNVPEAEAVDAIERLQAEGKRLAREVSQLKMKAAVGATATDQAEESEQIGPARVLSRRVGDLDKTALRSLSDSLKAGLKSGVVVLGSAGEGKASIVVSVTPDLTSRVHAGKVVKQVAPIIGGGGGGRPDFAEAGGKQPEKLDEVLAESRRVVRELLGG